MQSAVHRTGDDESAGASRPTLNIVRHTHGERLGWMCVHHTTIIPAVQKSCETWNSLIALRARRIAITAGREGCDID